jgi:hypothetical protein
MKFLRALFCADAQAEPFPTLSLASLLRRGFGGQARDCPQAKLFLPSNSSNFCLLGFGGRAVVVFLILL